MVLALNLEQKISNEEVLFASPEDLQDLGIKSVYNSHTKRHYWHRTFDALEMEVEGQLELVAGKSTFVSKEAVNFAVEKYIQYRTSLQQEGEENALEALQVAREYLGKKHLVQRAEMKLRTYCLEMIQLGDQDSLAKAKDLMRRGQLKDYSLQELWQKADERRLNVQLDGKRKAYLQELSKNLDDTNLTVITERAINHNNIPINTIGDGAYFTLIKLHNTYSTRKALEWSIQKNFSAELTHLAYQSWKKWQTIESQFNLLKQEKTPPAYLQALDYAVSQELDVGVYAPLVRQKVKLQQIQVELERGHREREGDVVYDALLNARMAGIELDELRLTQDFITNYSAKRWELVTKTLSKVKTTINSWWNSWKKTEDVFPKLVQVESTI